MSRVTLLWVVCAALLCSQVEGWGVFKKIGGEISRVSAQVSQHVSSGVAVVHREVERIGDQISDVAHGAVMETERFGQNVKESVSDLVKPLLPDAIEEPIIIQDWPQSAPPRSKCWPLGGVTVDFQCSLAGNKVNCRQPMEVGTVAVVTCKPAYKLPEDYLGHTNIECNASFEWSQTVRRCIPDCGRRNVAERPDHGLIDVRSMDRPAVTPESPWHVGIYKAVEGGGYAQICAGSIITENLVITAANCFWDTTTNSKQSNVTQFKVVGGKHYRDWDHDEVSQQRRGVEHVYTHERFRGRVRLSAYNIALVKLTEKFELTSTVNVVCVDWHNTPDEAKLAAADDGIVASWADNDAKTASDVNTPVQLAYRPFLTCSDTIDEDNQVYLTSDKICGAAVGTLTCPDDAGVGYVFPFDTVRGPRYYLRGIGSGLLNASAETEGRCDEQQLALFTHFHGYREWVQKIVLEK